MILEEKKQIIKGPHVCHVCGVDCVNIIDFNSHIASHEGVTYKCPNCDKTFRSENTFKNHRRAENSGKMHTCQQCGKNFQLQSSLLNHIKTHSSTVHGCQLVPTCKFKTKSYSHFREHNRYGHNTSKEFSAPSATKHLKHHLKCVVIAPSSMDLFVKHLESILFFIITTVLFFG